MQEHTPLSWKLVSDFNALPSLFQDQNLPYTVETYVCTCSHVKIIRKVKEWEDEEENYTCEACENSYFYDANALLKEAEWFSPVDTIFPKTTLQSLEPRMSTNPLTQEITLYVAIDIPSHIDYLREKVQFTEKKLFEVTLKKEGTLIQKPLVYFGLGWVYANESVMYYSHEYEADEIRVKQHELLIVYTDKILRLLKTHALFQNNPLLNQCHSLKEVHFFMQYPHLMDATFLKWKYPELLPNNAPLSVMEALLWVANHRPEKSFKKAIFSRYELCMKLDKSFDHLLMQALAVHMKDVNCAKTLIHLDLDISEEGVRSSIHCAYLWSLFLEFLTSRFSDTQVAKLLRHYIKLERFWLIDSMEILHEIWMMNEPHHENPFSPLPQMRCEAVSIHNVLNTYYRWSIYQSDRQITFTYNADELRPCVENERFWVQVPLSALELYKWADTMHNCLAGYARKILKRESMIYGFFEEGKLVFVVELQHNRVVQARSVCNQDLLSRHSDYLEAWYKQFFLKGEKEEETLGMR